MCVVNVAVKYSLFPFHGEDAARINPLPFCGYHVAGEKLYVCNEVFLLNVLRINPLPDYDCYLADKKLYVCSECRQGFILNAEGGMLISPLPYCDYHVAGEKPYVCRECGARLPP